MKITELNFESKVLQSPIPVVVDCYTQWCGPCKILKPLLVDVVKEAGDKVRLGFLDVEENTTLAEQLQITGVPKVLIFKNGEMVQGLLGMHSREKYKQAIEAVMD